MERKMMDSLRAWKENPRRMPLLLDGARQVGKTYTALTFGKEYYKNTVYFNMEDSSEIQAIFERDFNFVLASQKALNDAYIADMAKYAAPQETVRIMAAWGSIPAQLSKENHKFQYRVIRSGARAHDYEMPLQRLEAAGVINRCIRVSEGRVPLTAFADPGAFKIYMADTGLLCSRFDIAANLVLSGDHRMDGFKGALTENYIMQALVTAGIQPYYWTLQQNAELDFVFQDRQGNIIPLEAKSAEHVRAKSLGMFMKRYDCPYAIRVSSRNFGFENGIQSIPLYALFCLTK